MLGVVGCSERKPVYNLTVDEARLFYANGVLSSNTASEDHCLSGDTMIRMGDGSVARLDRVPGTGVVMTDVGPRPYRSARRTRRGAPTVVLRFDDGSTVRCTSDHRFMRADGAWVEAGNLLGEPLCGNLRAVSVTPAEPADVWCLTVPSVEHFQLANGARVGNCADEVRYRTWRRHSSMSTMETEGTYAHAD